MEKYPPDEVVVLRETARIQGIQIASLRVRLGKHKGIVAGLRGNIVALSTLYREQRTEIARMQRKERMFSAIFTSETLENGDCRIVADEHKARRYFREYGIPTTTKEPTP